MIEPIRKPKPLWGTNAGISNPALTGMREEVSRIVDDINRQNADFDRRFSQIKNDEPPKTIPRSTDKKKPAEIDFSEWENGYVTETLDDGTVCGMAIEFDENDRPIKFTDAAGHETVIVW